MSSSILTGILLQIAEQFLGIYVCDVDKKEKLDCILNSNIFSPTKEKSYKKIVEDIKYSNTNESQSYTI